MIAQVGILVVMLIGLRADEACRVEVDPAAVVATATRLIEEGVNSKTDEDKYVKLEEARELLSRTIEEITASKKVYTDDELYPLYVFRAMCSYELCDYKLSLNDYEKCTRLSPNRITPWARISLIKSSAPDAKLRQGKEAIVAADRAVKAYEIAWAAAEKDKDHLTKLQVLISLGDARIECVFARAAAHAENGNFKEALTVVMSGLNEGRDKSMKIEQFRNSMPNRLPERSKK